MLRIASAVALAVAMLGTTGCASIVGGQNQPLSVATRDNGNDVAGAKCSLANDKGTWFVTSPGSVTVRRSYNDLQVSCELDGSQPGSVTAKSSTKPLAFGNILFGGVIGAGVDISTGAAYDYPELITVEMGKASSLTAAPQVAGGKQVDTQSQAEKDRGR